MTNDTNFDSSTAEPAKSDPAIAPVRERSFFRHRRGDAWFYLATGVSIVFACCFLAFAIWPRYKDPITRLYSTRLGYPTVAREFNQPFPVEASTVEKRTLASSFQGEGTVSSEPNLVPMVPVGRIMRIHARIGDTVKKGQLLLEIDDRFENIKVAEAKTALETALRQQQRAIATTNFDLQFERPELEKIRLETSKVSLKIYDELLAIDRVLASRDYVSKRDTLLDQLQAVQTEGLRRVNEYNAKTAEKGYQESLMIADNTVMVARLEVKFKQMELEDYKVYAPCDGVIERCFVRELEYNQGPGTPAFLIDESKWFEARMDQTTLGQFTVGDRANVYLQSFPEQAFPGRIERVIPIVSYDLGGPKATRPVRPLGTGAPEWPSTFAVRIKLDPANLPVIHGFTGFARMCPRKEVVAIPQQALFGRSGRTGMVYTIDQDNYSPKKVVFGSTSDGWVEICSGLEPGMRVLTEGFQLLRPGDQAELIRQDGNAVVPSALLKFAAAEPTR